MENFHIRFNLFSILKYVPFRVDCNKTRYLIIIVFSIYTYNSFPINRSHLYCKNHQEIRTEYSLRTILKGGWRCFN